MDDSLCFLTILAKALQQPQPRRSLAEAFAQIKRMGAQARYSEGFSNFERFMDIACCHADAVDTDHVRELMAELATGTLEPTEQEAMLLRMVESHPARKAEYEQMRAEQAGQSPSRASVPVIGVFGPEGNVGEMVFTDVPARASVEGVTPGVYVLKLLNTGRVLWEGELSAEDLTWTAAYGARDLDLAAQTEQAHKPPTHQWVLCGGEAVLRTFAGIEKGTIEIELTR